jgi:hypothetical protein
MLAAHVLINFAPPFYLFLVSVGAERMSPFSLRGRHRVKTNMVVTPTITDSYKL